ncbi:peptidoglycan recognition protein [Streptomyces sp. NPDC007088]|uniref:peptidoglycan recognition protein family protein n=1 Tax=Streptomyces sp. NPDC007088 TaxID=3364773 RepID=UPI0036C125E6
MRVARGSDRRRRPLVRAATGVAATAAATLLVLALVGAPPFGADGGARRRPPSAQASPPSPADALKPPIVTREQWGADPHLLDQKPHYADSVHAVVIHHTDNPNGYDCADSPHLVREIYEAHAVAKGWGDIGYNFLVDKCGTIFEGRLGGVDRAVIGAHTVGLNTGTTGIAAIGTYTAGVPVPRPLRESVEKLIAWKLGLTQIDPAARTQLVSTNSNSRFPKDTAVNVPTVLGHIEAYETDCPGEALMRLLPTFRKDAAHLQSEARVLAQGDGARPGHQKGRGQQSPPSAPARPESTEDATDHRIGPGTRNDSPV